MAVRRADVISAEPKCCRRTISSRTTSPLATTTSLSTTQCFELNKICKARKLDHFSGQQLCIKSGLFSINEKSNNASFYDRGYSSRSSSQSPVDTLNPTTTSKSNATSIQTLFSELCLSPATATSTANKDINNKSNNAAITTSIQTIPSQQLNEPSRTKISSTTTAAQQKSSKQRIGPYRRAAMSVVAKRSFLKAEVAKKNRRFPCYVSGFLKLPPPRPSRCWPLLTDEEGEGDNLRGQIEWERYSSMDTSWEPENGW